MLKVYFNVKLWMSKKKFIENVNKFPRRKVSSYMPGV